MNRLKEIEERLSAIKAELNNDGADLDALESEITTLKEERKTILANAEKRKSMINEIVNLPGSEVVVDFAEERSKAGVQSLGPASPEYRNAFLKRLQGNDLSEIEQRALTSVVGSVGGAIPTQTQDEILKKLKQYAPLLDEITLLQVAGNVKFVIEGTVNDAALHAEGTTITASADTLVTVSLAGYEINKLITISKTVATMSINAFENWLTDMLAEGIANRITAYLISGTGSSQPTGLEKAQTWGSTNSITVAFAGSLTATNVQALIGLLPGGYDNGAKMLMSKKTLFTDFMPLQDNTKHRLVTKEGAKYYCYGYEIMLDERITLHESFLGNLKKAIVGNLSENVNVTSAFDVKTNSFDYLGSSIFDSKIGIGEAVVKLIKATS